MQTLVYISQSLKFHNSITAHYNVIKVGTLTTKHILIKIKIVVKVTSKTGRI